MILTDQDFITHKQLPFELRQTGGFDLAVSAPELSEITDEMSLDYVEKIHLSKVLKSLEGNKSKASKVLGISRATLRAKIKKYSLSDNL
jgi:transcriptional regulator with PAS, ATPase and Fis domain